MTNFSEYAKRLVPDEVKLAMFSQKPPMWTGTQEEWNKHEAENEARVAKEKAENEANINKKSHEDGFGTLATDGSGMNTPDNIINRAMNPEVQKMTDKSLGRDADTKLSEFRKDRYNDEAVGRVINRELDAAKTAHKIDKATALRAARDAHELDKATALRAARDAHELDMEAALDDARRNSEVEKENAVNDALSAARKTYDSEKAAALDAARQDKYNAMAMTAGGTALAGLGIYGLYKLIKKLRSKPNKTPNEVATLKEATKQYQAKKANFSKSIK